MMTLLQRIPWGPRALIMWCGTLTGILLCFACSNADWATHHSVFESLGLLTGWFMAMGSPVILMLSKSPWDE